MQEWQRGPDGPNPLDEGWWSSVLAEASRAAPAEPAGRDASAPSGAGRWQPLAGAAEAAADWAEARRLYECDECVDLEVVGFNRGGLLVRFRALRGFVPASHLVDFPAQLQDEARKSALARLVGGNLRLKVIEYDPERGRVVLSQRAALAQPGSRQSLLQRLKPGDVISGVITNVCDFGAFVDLGGVEGLIHVSEVSWNRVVHPSDELANDQPVEVTVLAVDREQARVALSLKRLRPDPWAGVDGRYRIGQEVEGKVTSVVNFGAFVCVEQGLEGLIHVSELAEGHFLHPRNVVREGDVVRARILNIDGPNRRLSLSLRQADGAERPVH